MQASEITAPQTGPYRSAPETFTDNLPPNTNTDGCSGYQTWSSAFTATAARQLPADQIDFSGHPLDVTFDSNGRAWGIGEFGLRTYRPTTRARR